MAKRQREKPAKMEQRVVREPEWESQVKQTVLLASPIYIGQAQGEEKKTHEKRSQNWVSFIFSSFVLAHLHASRMYFPLLA